MKHHLALLVPLALAACATPQSAENTGGVADRDVSRAMALFPILDEKAGPEKNVVYSPASVDQAFGLLRLGAAGETADQLDAILPAPRNADYLRTDEKDVEVRLANALFLSDQFRFRKSYVDAAKSRYDATSELIDVSKPKPASDTINAWADEATDGLIPEVVSPQAITPDLVAILANALYFDGKWETKLTGGDQRNFLHGNGIDAPFKFVGKVLSLQRVEKGGWSAVRLPYANERYAMDVIMPTKRRVMDETPSPRAIEEFGSALGEAKLQLSDLLIPQFEVDYETSLKEPLMALGLTKPFTIGQADLSLMAEPGQLPLMVSEARHVTKLQVFDAGTRAAAVTTISIILTAGTIYKTDPVPFHADRPFIMVIRDLKENEILFVGRISDPQPFEPVVEDDY